MSQTKRRDQDGIFKRSDSPFWWISYIDASGKPVRRSSGIRRDADPAQLRVKAFRAKLVLDVSICQPLPIGDSRSGHTFDELMLLYLQQVTPTKKAAERDRYSAQRLYPVFTGRYLDTLTRADVRQYHARRSAEVSPGTIAKEIRLASAVLNWARRELE
jgi:hypothetical protein